MKENRTATIKCYTTEKKKKELEEKAWKARKSLSEYMIDRGLEVIK